MMDARVKTDTLDGFMREAVAEVRRIDGGEHTSGEAVFAYERMDDLLGLLTPNRWRLLGQLRTTGSTSIRALAKSLGRDYRGVHADVGLLLEAGLIERAEDKTISVPWSKIIAEIALGAAA